MDRDRAALNRLPRWLVPALAALPVVGLSLFFLWPLGTLLVRVLQPGSVGDALRAPGLGQVLWFTLWQAVASTALCSTALVIRWLPRPASRAASSAPRRARLLLSDPQAVKMTADGATPNRSANVSRAASTARAAA